jgi:hypothetical protein
MIKKGSWIEVEETIVCGKDFSVKIFVRGNCLNECEIGEHTKIKTITGHIVKGVVSKDKACYYNMHNLGKSSKEILMIKSR